MLRCCKDRFVGVLTRAEVIRAWWSYGIFIMLMAALMILGGAAILISRDVKQQEALYPHKCSNYFTQLSCVSKCNCAYVTEFDRCVAAGAVDKYFTGANATYADKCDDVSSDIWIYVFIAYESMLAMLIVLVSSCIISRSICYYIDSQSL